MTLWHLLVILSGAASFGSAWTAAQAAKRAGSTQFIVAVVVAAILAVSCAAVLEILGRQMFRRFVAAPENPEGRQSRGDMAVGTTYFFAISWCVIGPFLSYRLTALFVDFLQ
jgi:hypothetical protein